MACLILFLLIASLFTIPLVSADTDLLPIDVLIKHTVIRAERVKRQWTEDTSFKWTGWRCAGFNGLFLDCVGKK